jgi:hypothetical protein
VKFVKFARLGKQLRREIKAHPAKAAVLAVLLVVGMYYWAPVLAGWFSTRSMSTATQTARLQPAPPVPATPSAAAPVIPWHELVEGMKRDPLKSPAANVHTWRDPFRPSPRQVAILEQERQIRESLPKSPATKGAHATAKGIVVPPFELTPHTAGLNLTSTLVSASQRMATINGVIVEEDRVVKQTIVSEGSTIKVRASGGQESARVISPSAKKSTRATSTSATVEGIGPTATFEVVRIAPGVVTLEYRGRKYELTLAKPKLAGNLKLRKAMNKE